jgi:DNA-binding CsgD family transcriptional regulator
VLSSDSPSVKRAVRALETPQSQGFSRPRVRQRLVRPNHLLSTAEVADLVVSYREGASLSALSRRFAIHEQTVRAHLDRGGVPLRLQKLLTAEQVSELVDLYEAGATLRELGLQFDVAANTVRNNLLRVGVVLRPARRLPR